MEVWDIAKHFDMNVKEFCYFIGYNRQTVYIGGCRRKDRREESMRRLREKSQEMFNEDIKRAEKNREERLLAIEEFENRMRKLRYAK